MKKGRTSREKLIQSFNWISRERRGNAYVSYAQFDHLPASPFDFGHDGYAGSCNYGGNLLQLSARTDSNELVFARGDFPNSIYPIHAQRVSGGPCTLGLEMVQNEKPYHPRGLFGASATGSSFYLGRLLDRGSLNYRWPFHEYALYLNEDPDKDNDKVMWTKIEWKCSLLAGRNELHRNEERKMVHLKIVDSIFAMWEVECKAWDASHLKRGSVDQDALQEREREFLGRVENIYLTEQQQTLESKASRYSLWDANSAAVPLSNNIKSEESPSNTIGTSSTTSNNKNQASPSDPRSHDSRKIKRHMESGRQTGTCAVMSFVLDKTVYQVLRIEEGCWSNDEEDSCYLFPEEAQLTLEIGGSIRLSSQRDHGTSDKESEGPNVPLQRLGDPYPISSHTDTSQCTHDMADEVPDHSTARFRHPSARHTLEVRLYQLMDCEGHHDESNHESAGADQCYVPLNISRPDPKCTIAGKPGAYRAQVKLSARRTAVFIAALRLVQPPNPRAEGKWYIPSSQRIYDHVGSSLAQKYATAAMWETIFFHRCLLRRSFSRFAEVHLIGRTLEKILQVDMVPLSCPPDCQRPVETCPAALISNIFAYPAVDYKSLFWKVRFLVKTLDFLQFVSQGKNTSHGVHQTAKEPQKPNLGDFGDQKRRAMRSIATKQRERVRIAISRIAMFLGTVIHKPDLSIYMEDTGTMSVVDPSNRYYICIALWYIYRNTTGLNLAHLLSSGGLLPKVNIYQVELKDMAAWHRHVRFPMDNSTISPKDKDKVTLLQWYHYGSILGLCQEGFLPSSWERQSKLNPEVYALQSSALLCSAAKLWSKSPYCANDEIFDRLAFLGLELGLEVSTSAASTVASLSMDRVKKRDYTRELNIGQSDDLDGPWEVHALCHHSRLKVFSLDSDNCEGWRALEQKAEEVETFKAKICSFLNSEGLLVASWDRSHLRGKKEWVNSDASAVLASTFLDLYPRDEESNGHDQNAQGRSTYDLRDPTAVAIAEGQRKMVQEMVYMESLMTQQTSTLTRIMPESGTPPPIEWINTWTLPRQYNPENFFESLEDTPEKYSYTGIERITIPIPLKRFMVDRKMIERGFLLSSLQRLEDGRRDIFVADICDHRKDIRNIPARNTSKPSYRLFRALYDSLVDQNVRHRTILITNPRPSPVLLTLLVYVFCTRSAPCMSNHMLRISQFSFKEGDWFARITLLSWFPKSRKLCPICQKLWLCECHASSADQRVADSVIISLPYYFDALLRAPVPERLESTRDICNAKDVARDVEQGVPKVEHGVGDGQGQSPNLGEYVDDLEIEWATVIKYRFKLQASSLMLSTNAFGDFSKCCIVSKCVSQKRLEEMAGEIRQLRLRLIHQPQTARCLAFFLMLRELSQHITFQYENAMNAISYTLMHDPSFEMGTRVWTKEWTGDDSAVRRYEFSLWTLESLYKLQTSLRNTMASLQEARETLGAQVKHGPGTRSPLLERECQENLFSFDSSLAGMLAVKIKLDAVIESVTRYKDNVGVVMTLTDSRTSLAQNRTIERLTYLTIVYLPIGIISAIFAIPEEHHIVPKYLGSLHFGVYIVVTALVTFAFAYCVMSILKTSKRAFDMVREWIWWIIPRSVQKGMLRFDDALRTWFGDRRDSNKQRRCERKMLNEDQRTLWRWKREDGGKPK